MLATVVQAIGLFAVTNIDDIVVLALFFARGAGRPGTTRRIAVGQYVGFVAILAAALLATLGAHWALPSSAIPYFGLIPLVLGIRAAWQAWRGEDDDELGDGTKVAPLVVAAVTFANGGDNIGVYVPVFLSVGARTVALYCVTFLLMVAVLVAAAKFVATRPGIDEALERWERVLFPLVLIVLGCAILIHGGAFGL
ncbi:putative permease, cadmium resistance protein [Corynebacterium uterequi]|uniref:Putative permease, cadmium resistance protein n=2 Tax=Corynebacterium uterequi TaxID=1072256 RepID=A0A0G3HDB2_9CORY|nr:putative permease, cadmium resistance protein [Corynebacterium uterequi]